MRYTVEERLEFLRAAAYVSRMHVNRIIGTYNSHEHVHNMTNMLLVLHPEPTIRLVKLVHWHDAGEFGSGDVPSPAKPFFDFGEVNNKVEELVRREMGLEIPDVTKEESQWLKSLDWLEFYLFLMDQVHMGNNFVRPILGSFEKFLERMKEEHQLPIPVAEYYEYLRAAGRPSVTNDWLMEDLKETLYGQQ